MAFESKFVSDFLYKLKHPLEEVRFRALKNISNKIERKIITIDDLCRYREFIPYLLEWFNYDIVKHQETVLKLIEMGSKIESGGKHIIKVGGIEFLTQLKIHSKPTELQIIDRIIDNLLKINPLEYLTGNCDHTSSCSYLPKTGNNDILKQSKRHEFQQKIGYFQSSLSNDTYKNPNETKTDLTELEENNIMKLSIHPIIPLTLADKKVLSGSMGTLKSDDFRVVLSGIQFFTDVILEDFPAPVFLQRQGVLRILLQFVSSRQYSTAAVRALLKLVLKMLQYIEMCLDPNFFSTKNTYGIIKQVQNEFEDDYHWVSDELLNLQYEPNMAMPTQLPVPVFSLQTIYVCLCQIAEIDTDSNWIDLFQLISGSIKLFRESLGGDLRRPYLLELWNLKDQINEVFNLWSRLLAQYSIIEDINCRQLSNNRQIYLCLFSIFWDFVSSLYSPEMALKHLQELSKTELCRAQFDKCLLLALGEKSLPLTNYTQLFDQTLSKINIESKRLMESCESLIRFFLNNNEPIKFAEQCVTAAQESLNCLEYVYGIRFCKEFVQFFSLIGSIEIFVNREDLFVKCEMVLEELMNFSSISISKAVFTEVFEIVANCISVEELSKPKTNAERKINFILRPNIFKYMILYGLHSKTVEIQETSIAMFCRFWDSQGILSQNSWKRVMELTWQNVIYLHPLSDTNTRIGRQILQFSLKSNLSQDQFSNNKLTSEQNFKDNIVNVLPLLYNKNPDVRKETSQYLEQFLQADRLWSCQVNVRNMKDFLVSSKNDNKHERLFSMRSNGHAKELDTENFKKVFDIYLSDSVDISVRKSAAEQLGIFLQVPNMHNYFTSNGGLHYIVELLKGNKLDKNHMSILVPSTVLILFRSVQYVKDIRNSLYKDTVLIDNLVQMALYFCYDKQCVADISSLLALIVFDSVIKQDSNGISMPDVVIDRILLPFGCSKYVINEASKNLSVLSDLSSIPNQRWCYQESFERNLRIHWNLLKHGGLDNYLAYKYSFFGKKILSLEDNMSLIDEILPCVPKLILSENDLYVLNNSIPQLILCDNLQKIDNATNHCQVQASLISVELVLIMCTNHFLNVNIYEILNDTSLWISSLRRFLLNIPSCSADYILLEYIMDVFENIIKLPLITHMENFITWLVQIITTPNNSLVYCLQKGDQLIGKTDSRRLTLAKNKIESRLPPFFVLLLRYLNLNTFHPSLNNTDLRVDIISIHKIVYDLTQERLKRYVNDPFDNLSMLLHYVNLLSVSLEMKYNFHQGDTLQIISNCVSFAGDLIIKFQNNREESSITFMGSGVVHYLLRILIEWICNPSDDEVDALIEGAVGQTGWLRKTPWLIELLGYRSVDIRAMSVSLISKLIQFDQSRNILFQHCSDLLPESIWSVALTLYLDTSEALIVRSGAITILENLMAKLPLHNSIEIAYKNDQQYTEDKFMPIFIDQSSSVQIIGIEGFYQQLLYQDFFRKVGLALTNFYTLPFINCSYLKHRPLLDPECRDSLTNEFPQSPNINHVLNQMRSDCALNISTPLMISSLMSFFCNLYFYIPHQISSQFNELRINTLIMNVFDPHILTLYLKCTDKLHFPSGLDLISAYLNSIKLMRLQINTDSSLRDSFLIDEKFIETIIELFVATKPKSESNEPFNTWLIMLNFKKAISQLRIEIIYLLICLVVPTPINSHVQLMLAHVASQVEGVFSCVKEMIEFGNKKSVSVVMYFISVFLCLNHNESKYNPLLTSLEKQNFPGSERLIIEEIVDLLMKKRENLSRVTYQTKSKIENNISERINVHNTLKILLGVSKKAKQFLVKVGFIESALVEIKYLHNKLDQNAQMNIDICTQKMKTNSDNKCSPWKQVMKELISVLELLQNLFYDDTDAQTIAVSAGFPGIAYRLWTLALLESELMYSLLNCFINFSADSTKTAKSIVTCHLSNQLQSQPPSIGSSVSLIENICRLTSADIAAFNLRETTVKLVFRLLSNLVWCHEGINILLRCRFLDKFEQLNPNQLQKSSSGIALQHLWLGLLTSLSFTEEGQNAIMKCNGSGIMKVLKTQNNIPVFRSATLLIIRNLCTHPVIKVKLIVDGSSLIENINNCLDSNNLYIRQLALSTLKALLYSNQKIRVYLKSANLVSKLTIIREIYENDSKNNILSDIISLLKAFQDGQDFRTQ